MTQEEIKINIENQIAAFKKTLKPDEIATSVADFNPKKTKLIDGLANFEYSKIKNLGSLTIVRGRADFEDSQVENLGNLTTIGGTAYFGNSKVKNLGNLTTIGRTADFRSSQVENLGNLTNIGGAAFFINSQIKNLGNLTTIYGTADFSDSQIKDLGNLSYIGGNISANGNKLTKEQIELHLKKINEINIIKKGLYYISNGKVFIKPSVLVDNQHFFIRDLKFNDNGTIAMK